MRTLRVHLPARALTGSPLVRLASLAALCALLASASASSAFAAPEDPGTHAVTAASATLNVGLDAQGLDGAFPLIQTDIYAPVKRKRWPVVVISHGVCNTQAEFTGWAQRLASRGFVVIVPNRRQAAESIALNGIGQHGGEYVPSIGSALPLGGTASGTCLSLDPNVHGEDLLRLLRWAISQQATRGSFLQGKVDARRLGIIGHSLGGVFAAEAAVRSESEGPRLGAVVLLDNADHSESAKPAASVPQDASILSMPTAVIASEDAEHPIKCEIGTSPDCLLSPTQTFNALPESLPRLGLRITGALHGEAEDPDHDDGDAANVHRIRLFERYGMAWMECFLQHDAGAGPYLNGRASNADQAAKKISVFPGSPRTSGTGACP